MNWETFPLYAAFSVVLIVAGACIALGKKDRSAVAVAFFLSGIAVLAVFVGGFWLELQRPPMRTMGETRLWYSLFLAGAGLLVYLVWGFRWILLLAGVFSSVFSIINIMRPEIHDMTLMPALQSFWFVPHVTVYMLSYSILACAALLALAGLAGKGTDYFGQIDDLVYIGTGLLFLGLLSGAVWAKAAWGDFWGWDPKETWAAVTCAGYLAYIHLRFTKWGRKRWLYALAVFSFLLLQMCWYGYRYLPSSASSMHTYNITQ